MKQQHTLALASLGMAIACLLSACGGSASASTAASEAADTSQPESTVVSAASEAVASEPQSAASAPAAASVEMQRIGTPEYGYLDVPATWVKFQDASGGDDVQYTDGSGVNIITMNVFSTDALSEEEKASFDAEMAASGLWQRLEENGATDVQGATVQVAGYDAYQVYAYYEEDGVYLVTWCFAAEDDCIHYLAAEGTQDDIMPSVGYMESWSLTE